jgi:flagellar biosynthesis/type III secretory pathway M-ring protein FliF/YscJ
MVMENLYAVLGTLVTVLGSAGAWRYYEKRMDSKREEELEFKYDCRARIQKLEFLLEESSKEKDELRQTVLELSTELAALRTKVELMVKKKG